MPAIAARPRRQRLVEEGRDYQALYNSRGCKQTIKGYRG